MKQKNKGAISQKVRKEVWNRSEGLCEVKVKCGGTFAVHMAHITSRKQIEHKTTANDLLHSCLACHIWLDQSVEGIRYKRGLKEREND